MELTGLTERQVFERMFPKDLAVAIEDDASFKGFSRVCAFALQQVPIRLARCGKKDPYDMDVDALDMEDAEAEENSENKANGDDEAMLFALKGSRGEGHTNKYCFLLSEVVPQEIRMTHSDRRHCGRKDGPEL